MTSDVNLHDERFFLIFLFVFLFVCLFSAEWLTDCTQSNYNMFCFNTIVLSFSPYFAINGPNFMGNHTRVYSWTSH